MERQYTAEREDAQAAAYAGGNCGVGGASLALGTNRPWSIKCLLATSVASTGSVMAIPENVGLTTRFSATTSSAFSVLETSRVFETS
jgi:hypothetical protein